MAYIKIFPIKSTVDAAVKYITNPNKTEQQLLVDSFGCSPETAALEFDQTREMGIRNNRDSGKNLAWHMIISFKPGEISDEKLAQEVGERIAREVLKGKYEYVLSTHVDKKHYHCHLVFNATSFVDHQKYRSNKKSYRRICMISNKICREYGLSENMPTGNRGRSYKEDMEFKRGSSWKAKLKFAVDRAIWTSVTYEEFLMKMREAGYEIRQGKYLAFRHPEQNYFTNVKSLGSYYTDENIMIRLEKNRHKARIPRNATREVRLFIEMSGYISRNDKPGYDRWARLNNLKESAKTFNYLSEHKLLNYEDFLQHCSDMSGSKSAAIQAIGNCDKRIEQHQLIQKKCNTYRICRDVITREKEAPDPIAYRKAHANEYKLHDALLKELQALGIKKLPSASKLKMQTDTLQKEKASLQEELQRIEKQLKTLTIIRSNFENLLAESGTAIIKENTIEPDINQDRNKLEESL